MNASPSVQLEVKSNTFIPWVARAPFTQYNNSSSTKNKELNLDVFWRVSLNLIGKKQPSKEEEWGWLLFHRPACKWKCRMRVHIKPRISLVLPSWMSKLMQICHLIWGKGRKGKETMLHLLVQCWWEIILPTLLSSWGRSISSGRFSASQYYTDTN